MRWLAAILCCLAGPVSATQDQWPALFDVSGVAADDVLNIRESATASAPIIGTLAPDAEGIEVIRPNDRETWGLINLGERSGWVSLAFLRRQPGQWLGAFPEIASCYGTEPFWNLERVDGTASLSGLDRPDISAPITWESGTLNHRGRYAFAAGEMTGIVSLQSCNDGMSDTEYGIDITLAIPSENTLYQGCCSLAP